MAGLTMTPRGAAVRQEGRMGEDAALPFLSEQGLGRLTATREAKQRTQRFKSTLNRMLLQRTGQFEDQLKNLLGV